MSPYFVKLFKKENKCSCCKASKKDGYSVCAKHLKYAKTRWRKWQIIRRNTGKCCYCHRKSFKGWLRCKTHTIINKKKCEAWGKKHPTHGHDSFIQRHSTFTDNGLCISCKPHRKVHKGFKRCWTCLKRNLLWSRGINTPAGITRKNLTLILKQNKLPLTLNKPVAAPPGIFKCSGCKKNRPQNDFHKFSTRNRPVASKCKDCRKKEYNLST